VRKDGRSGSSSELCAKKPDETKCQTGREDADFKRKERKTEEKRSAVKEGGPVPGKEIIREKKQATNEGGGAEAKGGRGKNVRC